MMAKKEDVPQMSWPWWSWWALAAIVVTSILTLVVTIRTGH
jgi:hypothetical protein